MRRVALGIPIKSPAQSVFPDELLLCQEFKRIGLSEDYNKTLPIPQGGKKE
jgi:hypothetical protein